MSDPELSVRAGLNIGIESTLLPFVQAGAGNLIPLNPTGDTFIMGHTDQAARVPFAAGPQGGVLGGWLFNTGPALANQFGFLFVDELGNEIEVALGSFISAPTEPNGIVFGPGQDFSFFCLAPGEKIIARVLPPAPPG